MAKDDDPLRAALAALVPASKGQGASAARTRIRAMFDDVTAARKRGVAWAQIAALLQAEGTRAADGAVLTPDEVRALYHAERYSRPGARRKRRAAQPQAARAGTPGPGPTGGQGAPPPPEPSEPPLVRAADPDLERRLSNLRTVTDVPPASFGAGWRRKGGQGDG